MANDNEFSNSVYLTDEDRKAIPISPLAAKLKAKAAPNLAIYDGDEPHEVVRHVFKLAQDALSHYIGAREEVERYWNKADEFYWMVSKAYNQSEMTRAIVAASTFHRISRRTADGAYLASYSDDVPMKWEPQIDPFDPSPQKKMKAAVCNGLNNASSYSMRKTDLKGKAKDVYHKLFKYSTAICYTPWDFQVETRKYWKAVDKNIATRGEDDSIKFIHKDTGEISSSPHAPVLEAHEKEYVCKDELGFYSTRLEDIYLDDQILNLDDQTILLHKEQITRSQLFTEAKSGNFINIEKITEINKFSPHTVEGETTEVRRSNAGKDSEISPTTEVYGRWRCWLLIPKIKVKQNKAGEVTDLTWDQNAEPRRYLMEVIGDLSPSGVIARLSESPYWDNGVPYISGHSHSDDTGFYNRGLVHLLETNMIQEQTAKGQLMDNRTLLNFRPMTVLTGRLRTKDTKITHNTMWQVTSQEAVKQLEVSDLSGTIHNTLAGIQDDSEKTGQTPSFFMGDNMGARTSATEFAAIRDQSSAPAMNDIRVVNSQIAGGYLRKFKKYAPQFLDRNVCTKFLDPNGKEVQMMLTADEFEADMVLKEVSVADFENKATMRQILMSLVQMIANPAIAPFINMPGMLIKVFKAFSNVFPNPEELLNSMPAAMQMMQAYLAQNPPQQVNAGMPMGGGAPGLPGGPAGGPPQLPNTNPGDHQPLAGRVEGQLAAAAGHAGA